MVAVYGLCMVGTDCPRKGAAKGVTEGESKKGI